MHYMTIVQFKQELVHALLGNRLLALSETVVSHVPTSTGSRRFRCAYCALFSKQSRTRFVCRDPSCQLPLGSVGTGRSTEDCFTLCHANKQLHDAVLAKHRSMKKTTNDRFK